MTYKMKSMFFSSIAHELRTPLNAIIPISIKLQEMVKEPKNQTFIKIILNSAYHLQNIVEDALDMGRIENNKFETQLENFDIRNVINEVSSILLFGIEHKQLKLLTIVEDSVPQVIRTDQKRYRQVLFNLVGNAIKFTFKGSITIHVFCDKKELLVTRVIDTGIGISEADQLKLFKFFGSLEHSKKINKGGMGLGLTISKLIV